jgi:2-pyrone-4,6-dicarboxylate lactonase
MNPPLPAGACNAHCHVFGPRQRFAYAADAPFVPAQDAPREALYALNDALGLQRCVVVQSTCHGLDNAVTEHAVAGRPHDYRGVALLDPTVPDAELARLDRAGFRGVRFNFMGHLGQPRTGRREVLALARRLAPLGWHLQVHGDARHRADRPGRPGLAWLAGAGGHRPRRSRRRGPTAAASRPVPGPAFAARIDHPGCWVKVSGVDRVSKPRPALRRRADPSPRRLVLEAFGDRVLWGNDWPHPNHDGSGARTNQNALVD